MSILRWLGLAPREEPEADRDAVRRIVVQLEAMEPASARRLALFAFLLARVANVDLDIGPAETEAMERLAIEHGRLSPAQAALVVDIAKAEHRLLGSTHNFLAAQEYRDLSTGEERRDLVRCMFAVAAADRSVSTPEEEEIRVVSRTLLIDDREYLAIRAGYSGLRAVMQGRPRGDGTA
jgi:uncharacterized tellurite resistance protein B-like protein